MDDVKCIDFNSKEGKRLKKVAKEILDVAKKHKLHNYELMAICWLIMDIMKELAEAEVVEGSWVGNEP